MNAIPQRIPPSAEDIGGRFFMSHSDCPTVAFFPSRPMRFGDGVIYESFVEAIGKEEIFVVWPRCLEELPKEGDPGRIKCLVGVSPHIDDIRQAQVLMGRLMFLGIRKSDIQWVLWNKGIKGELDSQIIESALGACLAKLPFDPVLITLAVNQKKSLQELDSTSALLQAIHQMAAQVKTWVQEQTPVVSVGEKEMDWRMLGDQVARKLWALDTIPNGDLEGMLDQTLHATLAEWKIESCPVSHLADLRQQIFDQVQGLGPIEKLMKDSSLNEIMVNGIRDVFVEKEGVLEKTSVVFENEQQLRTIVNRVVGKMGRRVDHASPLCDVRLPDGSRVNVVLPPLSLNGPLLTIRRFKPLFRSLNDLLKTCTLNGGQADQLKRAVHERKNILVAGNSGAGKTTLLNVLSACIPPFERIITLEDAAELQIQQPHVVRMETRSGNSEGLGAISMADLVVNALRMRPDRLIVGECRGAEVIPMIQAMNTGHDGSMTTLHANSAHDALKRLESLILLHAPQWPLDVVREQVRTGIDLVVYLKRDGQERKLQEILHV
ncbi:MAG: hypothetical protein KCHDKBKB_01745 [Elusimicrobia bacterium]|nr:hypothetical protein [Elusimicrobiota bacterium]